MPRDVSSTRRSYYANLTDMTWFFWHALRQSPHTPPLTARPEPFGRKQHLFDPHREITYPRFLKHQFEYPGSYPVLDDLERRIRAQIGNQIYQFMTVLGEDLIKSGAYQRMTSENLSHYNSLTQDYELKNRHTILQEQHKKETRAGEHIPPTLGGVINAGFGTGTAIISQLVALSISTGDDVLKQANLAATTDILRLDNLRYILGLAGLKEHQLFGQTEICPAQGSYEVVLNNAVNAKIKHLKTHETIGCPALFKPSQQMQTYAREKLGVTSNKSVIEELYQEINSEFQATRRWYEQLPKRLQQRIYWTQRTALEGKIKSKCPFH